MTTTGPRVTFSRARTARRVTLATAAVAGFVLANVAANVVTSRYGFVPVGFGLTATAGTYLAGACFVARDAVQDTGGRRLVFLALALGSILSWAFSAPAIAAASVVAFLVSELADLAVYTPLRVRGYIRAAVASNLVGSVVDSLLFLAIAGFGLAPLPGQLIGKTWVTLVVVLGVAAVRTIRRATRPAVAA